MKTQFTEAIKLKDGLFYNLDYHQRRINQTLAVFGGEVFDLKKTLEKLAETPHEGLFKCRVLYDAKIEKIEFTPYDFQTKKKVGVVVKNDIDYHFKYANRAQLENLIHNTDFDDVIIIKNGFVTDALFSNLVFESEDGLFTPDTFLLNGTKRQNLLENGTIREKKITLDDFHLFKKIRFINALIDLEDEIFVEIKDVVGKII